MRISIFSGGTGSIALQQGLISFFPKARITNIINAYDDGKSTGVCRKLFDVLGPSDIRKNQWTQYKNLHDSCDMNLVRFFEDRIDIRNYGQIEDILNDINMQEFKPYFRLFFDKLEKSEIEYDLRDFNLANIVYAAMFSMFGYEYTINYFKDMLKIPDNIVLSSYSNVILQAETELGKVLHDEASIVNYSKSKDKIKKIKFTDVPKLNKDVLDVLEKSDLVIFSSGTQWASLIPTYWHKEIGNKLEELDIPMFMIINNEQDKDMLGVNSLDLINILSDYLPIFKINYFLNKDGDRFLNDPETLKGYNRVVGNFGNNKGKHNAMLLGREILKEYIKKVPPKRILFDFDDTLFSRNPNETEISIKNIELLDKLTNKYKVSIITGNSPECILKKIDKRFNINFLEYFMTSGGVYNYLTHKIMGDNDGFRYKIENFLSEKIKHFIPSSAEIEIRNKTCFSIKPVIKNRNTLVKQLNDYFDNNKLDYKAHTAGLTTIDIMRKQTDKEVFAKSLVNDDFIFIGDSCFEGNDVKISLMGKYRFNVYNILETKEIMEILYNAKT
jgi:2-phospho-L-lactate transferase/gluconeogenesis factor (CofD/UPF0052 family)